MNITTTKSVFSPAAAFVAALTLLALPAVPSAGQRDPFPLGRSMMSQGAIVETEGAMGREPWVSAAFYRDTLQWGASMAAISYHGGGAAAQYAAGGFWTAGPIVYKASLMQLDVMSVYYEQTATVSAGSSWRFLSFGVDAQIYRTGLYDSQNDRRTMAAAGAAAIIQNRRISADAAVRNITVLSSREPGTDPPAHITFRVCTVRNRYGSQGAMIKITPSSDAPARLIIAQEYRIGQVFAFAASIASNPTMIGFGISIEKSPVSGSTAVVNHPFLGWSRGMAVDYSR